MRELNMYRQLGIKPNFTEIGRGYGLHRQTVAKYWRQGEEIEDRRGDRASAFDEFRDVIERKAALPGESTPIPFTPLRRHRVAVLLGPVGPLELLGAEVSQRRVRPDPVAGALDALEDLQRRLIARLERAGVHALGFDEPHGRLHRGVVPRRRYGAHGGPDARGAHRLPEQGRRVLGAVARMADAALGGRRLAIAILGASSASSAVMRADIDQPTTLLDHTSIKTAR